MTHIISGDALYGASDNIECLEQIYTDVAEKHWTTNNPNSNATYPRLPTSKVGGNLQPPTYWQCNMNFFRLRNMEIRYTLPKHIYRRLDMSSIRVHTQGVNLLTFSKFRLWDLEFDSNYGNIYPQVKTTTLDLSLSF